MTPKNTRQFLFAGYTYEQEQQFKKHRRDLTQQQVQAQHHERD